MSKGQKSIVSISYIDWKSNLAVTNCSDISSILMHQGINSSIE